MNIIVKDLYAEELLVNSEAIQFEINIPRDIYADELLAHNNEKDASKVLLRKEAAIKTEK